MTHGVLPGHLQMIQKQTFYVLDLNVWVVVFVGLFFDKNSPSNRDNSEIKNILLSMHTQIKAQKIPRLY